MPRRAASARSGRCGGHNLLLENLAEILASRMLGPEFVSEFGVALQVELLEGILFV